MARKPETTFRHKVDILLSQIPNSWFESIQQRAIRGSPDKIGVINGHFVAIEIKTDVYKATPLQEYKLKQITAAKGHSYVLTPLNLEYVIKELNLLAA